MRRSDLARRRAWCLFASRKVSVSHVQQVMAPPPMMCSLMRVAPRQKVAPQLLHLRDGEVACSVTHRDGGPQRA